MVRPSTGFGRPDDDAALARDVAGTTAASTGRMHAYLIARTAFFDSVVLAALERGIAQVVLLGAGYDGRALRFANGTTRWFEVDHPATQQDKLARLGRLGIASPATFVPADFRTDDAAGLLRDRGFEAGRPALFVLEGVASYLESDVLASLLGSMGRLAAPGSQLAVSVGIDRSQLRIRSRLRARRFRRAVASLGEPIRNTLGPRDVDALLEGAGWRRCSLARPAEAPDGGGMTRRLGLVLAEPVPA